jgi:hypothetical protein
MAVAAGADLKWLTNSSALLGRPIRNNRQGARWWGLVRLLVDDLGLSLKSAAAAASTALLELGSSAVVRAAGDPTGSATVVVDLPRYRSIFLGNLSRALVHETPRRRGRRAGSRVGSIAAARRYGVDIDLVRAALARSPAERLALLEENAAFLRSVRSSRK